MQPNVKSFTTGKCCCTAGDIQMAIGQLFRVGIGGFIFVPPTSNVLLNLTNMVVGGPLFVPVFGDRYGPKMDDPLYCKLVVTKEFTDGWKITQTVTYDPEFQDMSVDYVYPPAQPPLTYPVAPLVNVLAVDPLSHKEIVSPVVLMAPADPDAGHTYSRFSDATKQPVTGPATVPPGATTLTATYPAYTEVSGDPNPGKVHYGATITYTLSVPKTFADYATLAGQLLDQITLQDGTLNPAKVYHGIGFSPSTGQLECDMKLRYLAEMPAPTSPLLQASYTNLVCVRRNRAAVSGYSFASAFFSFSANNYVFPAWNPLVNWAAPNLLDNRQFYQLALAANGMPFQVDGLPNGAIPTDYPPPITMPVPLSTQYIFSIKSSVRTAIDLTPTCESGIYDVTNAIWGYFGTACPAGAGEYIFQPGDVGGFGYLRAIFKSPVACGVSQTSYIYDHPNGSRSTAVAAGQSITLYAVTADRNWNWVDNVQATWSYSFNNGNVPLSNLIVAPDGKSAVYTGPNTPGAVQILVTVPGVQSQDVYFFHTP